MRHGGAARSGPASDGDRPRHIPVVLGEREGGGGYGGFRRVAAGQRNGDVAPWIGSQPHRIGIVGTIANIQAALTRGDPRAAGGVVGGGVGLVQRQLRHGRNDVGQAGETAHAAEVERVEGLVVEDAGGEAGEAVVLKEDVRQYGVFVEDAGGQAGEAVVVKPQPRQPGVVVEHARRQRREAVVVDAQGGEGAEPAEDARGQAGEAVVVQVQGSEAAEAGKVAGTEAGEGGVAGDGEAGDACQVRGGDGAARGLAGHCGDNGIPHRRCAVAHQARWRHGVGLGRLGTVAVGVHGPQLEAVGGAVGQTGDGVGGEAGAVGDRCPGDLEAGGARLLDVLIASDGITTVIGRGPGERHLGVARGRGRLGRRGGRGLVHTDRHTWCGRTAVAAAAGGVGDGGGTLADATDRDRLWSVPVALSEDECAGHCGFGRVAAGGRDGDIAPGIGGQPHDVGVDGTHANARVAQTGGHRRTTGAVGSGVQHRCYGSGNERQAGEAAVAAQVEFGEGVVVEHTRPQARQAVVAQEEIGQIGVVVEDAGGQRREVVVEQQQRSQVAKAVEDAGGQRREAVVVDSQGSEGAEPAEDVR